MAVEADGRLYHGADAMNALSLLSNKSGTLNRLFGAIFRHRHLATVLYPFLRAGRNATLFALGREPLGKRDASEAALLEIFSRIFGLYVVIHGGYQFWAGSFRSTTWLLIPAGLILFLVPRSRRAFIAAIGLLAVDAVLEPPTLSNHTILQNFLLLAAVPAGLWYWLRGASWDQFFQSIRPVARCLLLTMYAFGIFHKINSDFLDPSVSCAVALWREMPPPIGWLDTTFVHYSTIYGTFIVEAVIVVMLMVPKWRHYGVATGMAFHGLIAFSGFALYAAFSTLTIALHTLFLSPSSALRIVERPGYARFAAVARRPITITLVIVFTVYFALASLGQSLGFAASAWLLLLLAPATVIIIASWQDGGSQREPRFLWSKAVVLNVVSLGFFLNCAAPYFGLKTSQAMNMFANWRIEGGVNNHLLVRSVGPFHYLENVAVITAATGSGRLRWYADNPNLGIVYYELLNQLDHAPGTVLSYRMNGVAYENVQGDKLLSRDGDLLHHRSIRKYFHFKPVSLESPVRCAKI